MPTEIRIRCRKRDLEPVDGKVAVSIEVNGGHPRTVWVEPHLILGNSGSFTIPAKVLGLESIEVILPDKTDPSQSVRISLKTISN